MYISQLNKNLIYVAKTRNYDMFVAKIYDYAHIDSIWGFPGFIDSPASYATLCSGPQYWSSGVFAAKHRIPHSASSPLFHHWPATLLVTVAMDIFSQ